MAAPGAVKEGDMLGCSYGKLFQVTVAGGSYQEGLTTHIQGVPTGILLDEAQIYSELLQRKPGQGELSSPRREPDIPVIYNGVNAADTMTGFHNEGHTNGTPLVILIPNLDRHFEHIEQYRSTNRTPRPRLPLRWSRCSARRGREAGTREVRYRHFRVREGGRGHLDAGDGPRRDP